MTPTKTRPTTSIASMTSLPSWAAVLASGPNTGAMLTDAPLVSRERALDRSSRALAPLTESRRRLSPGLAVAWKAVGPQLGAQRDQRRQLGHGLDAPGLGDP